VYVCFPYRDAFPTRRSSDLMSQESRNIQSLVVVNPARHIAHRDHRRTRFSVEETCQVAADVAEALDDDPSALDRHPEIARILLQDRKSTRLNSSHVSISYAV